MPESATEPAPGFWRLVWSQALSDWKPTRDKVPWNVVTATLLVVAAVAMGVKMMLPPWVTIGVIPLGAALFFLWYLFRAPSKVWANAQRVITGLEATATQLGEQLAEMRSAIARLETVDNECSRLRAQLDATRGLELVPAMVDEYGPIDLMPVKFGDIEGPDEELIDRTVVDATLSILAINNSDHPTTIVRLWLRVSDPDTGAEIVSLSREDFGPWGTFMPPVEEFEPAGGVIGARGKQRFEFKFTAYYAGDLGRRVGSRKERAQMITLCVNATGQGTMCFTLPEAFFSDRPTPPANPEPPTASEQAPPSSRESSG